MRPNLDLKTPIMKATDLTHCVIAHCNFGIAEITSFSSYKDGWLLDTRATSHMTFRKMLF